MQLLPYASKVAGSCQQCCWQLTAMLLAVDCNVVGIWQLCCRHMAATTQIKMFKPNKRGCMTV